VSTVILLLRVALSLGVVLGLLTFVARAARKRGIGNAPGRTTARVEVVARQGLGRNSSVVIVRAAERALVLGVTETTVSLLAESPWSEMGTDDEPDAPGTTRQGGGPLLGRPSAWKANLEQLRERTVRRS
jgi:flagellar protein FliO/FliZ